MSTYAAQNLGVGKIQRIREGVKASLRIMVWYFLSLGILIFFGGKYVTCLFVSQNVSAIIGNVDFFLKILAVTGILLGVLCIFRSCVQGMGHGAVSLTGGVLELAGRAIVAGMTMYLGKFWCICLGYPLAWLFAAVFFIGVYWNVMKKI